MRDRQVALSITHTQPFSHPAACKLRQEPQRMHRVRAHCFIVPIRKRSSVAACVMLRCQLSVCVHAQQHAGYESRHDLMFPRGEISWRQAAVRQSGGGVTLGACTQHIECGRCNRRVLFRGLIATYSKWEQSAPLCLARPPEHHVYRTLCVVCAQNVETHSALHKSGSFEKQT